MSFTNDPITLIGKARMYAGDADTDSHILTDEQVTVCISDSGGEYLVAAYLVVTAKIALLSANPNSQTWNTYSQSTDLNSLHKLAESLKKTCEEKGLSVSGDSIAQFGRAEIARTRRNWKQVEANKAARGETC